MMVSFSLLRRIDKKKRRDILILTHPSTLLQIRTRTECRVRVTGNNQRPRRACAPFGRYRLDLFGQLV